MSIAGRREVFLSLSEGMQPSRLQSYWQSNKELGAGRPLNAASKQRQQLPESGGTKAEGRIRRQLDWHPMLVVVVVVGKPGATITAGAFNQNV